MNIKKIIPILFIAFTTFIQAQEPVVSYKLYGFIGNDFSYNSRQNVESVDGLFHIFPKPITFNSENFDTNATPQAEMLSINTRLGLDINGVDMLGAHSSAKIESDFSGFGNNFYVLRIRQAYAKLNWEKTELLIGQTWHPLFGSVFPGTFSLNAGAPFQPFNRSPQVRLRYNLSSSLTMIAAALYQMQNTSTGPIGPSASYLRNAVYPDVFLGTEYKTTHWTSGAGVDLKTIKPEINNINNITSGSAVIYAQYVDPMFKLKGKALWGENLSDQVMLSGYGVSKIDSITGIRSYTNFNIVSSWINAVYGKTWQVGAFIGLSQNLGTNMQLIANREGKFTAYGTGFYPDNQLLLDRLIRIAPNVSYNLPNLRFGLEYDFTKAVYGTLQSNGHVDNPYAVNNHRIVATMGYFF